MSSASRFTLVAIAGLAAVALGSLWSSAQQPATKGRGDTSPRLTFEVVKSFDAKYAGDTPGHIGRTGGLFDSGLKVALGDPVYRGEQKVGQITELTWNRANGSLDVEFDPSENIRVNVGDEVWIDIDGTRPSFSAAKAP